jgi:CheY-like chemotaxis protein
MKTRPRILLIDDDRFAMSYVTKALQESGYEVTQKCTVSDAIEYMKMYSQSIDGVILDVILPTGLPDVEKNEGEERSGGLSVFEYLQSAHPGIPILILSNITNGTLLRQFQSGNHVKIAWKCDHPPFEVVALIKSLVGPSNSGIIDEDSKPLGAN